MLEVDTDNEIMEWIMLQHTSTPLRHRAVALYVFVCTVRYVYHVTYAQKYSGRKYERRFTNLRKAPKHEIMNYYSRAIDKIYAPLCMCVCTLCLVMTNVTIVILGMRFLCYRCVLHSYAIFIIYQQTSLSA